jgi:tight adherence protein C
LAKLDQKCALAGRPWGLTGIELMQITWVGCAILAVAGALISTLLGFTWLPGVAIGLAAGFVPRGIVDSAADTATKEMNRRLPQFLDLLVLADQAGVEQVSALQLAATQTGGALGKAVGTAVMAIAAEKKDVTQVFGALAETTQVEAIQDLATALAISQKYSGATYSTAISAQAERMRIAYRQTVEKKINTLSTTMMLPVGLFIMPAILLIIIGPMLPAMARGLGGL